MWAAGERPSRCAVPSEYAITYFPFCPTSRFIYPCVQSPKTWSWSLHFYTGFGISLSSFASKSPFEIVSGAHRAYRSFWGKATSTQNRVFQLIPFWSDSRHRMASSLLSLLRCILWLSMRSPLVNAPRERQKRGYHAAVEAVYRRDMQLADGAGLTCVLTKTP